VTALLTVLDENHPTIEITLREAEPRHLHIECPLPVPIGALVKVVQDGKLWLGLVTEYHPGGAARIRVEHHLRNADELSLLADQFVGKRSFAEKSSQEPVNSTTVS
jgi:hypothetical protein